MGSPGLLPEGKRGPAFHMAAPGGNNLEKRATESKGKMIAGYSTSHSGPGDVAEVGILDAVVRVLWQRQKNGSGVQLPAGAGF